MSAQEVAHAKKLEVQLTELANLRHELQNLYSHATQELNAQRNHAATYKAQADAATAQNDALRKWNLQLAEELSLLTGQLHSATGGDADSSLAADATASSLSREHEAVVGSLVALRDGGSDVERRAAQKLIARLVSTGSGALLDAVERHTSRATRAAVTTSAIASAPSVADESSTSALVGQQQALLELASLSVRYVGLQSRVEQAERSARTDSERSELLERSAREMLGDLSEASRKISSLEARISPLVEEHARLEAEAKEASRRATNAQRVVARAGERHAELAAAVNALTGENRSLRNENLSLRQAVHDLGASEAEVASVVRTSHAMRARAGGAAREMEVTSVPTQNRRPAEVQPSSRQGSSPISELGEAEPMLGLRYLQERLERVRGVGARSSVSGAASAEVESPAFSAAY